MTSRLWNVGDPEPADRPAVVDDRGRLRDADGRLHPAHEPVTYLPDRQWVALGDTGVEVYHAGNCPCSRSQVWVRHRQAGSGDTP